MGLVGVVRFLICFASFAIEVSSLALGLSPFRWSYYSTGRQELQYLFRKKIKKVFFRKLLTSKLICGIIISQQGDVALLLGTKGRHFAMTQIPKTHSLCRRASVRFRPRKRRREPEAEEPHPSASRGFKSHPPLVRSGRRVG